MQRSISGNAVRLHGHALAFEAAYAATMKPLCTELSMPQSALDILLFLANNPGYDTARDICFYRHMKPGIVSFQVDRLVEEGYLARHSDDRDRRITHLQCTAVATDAIERGRSLQSALGDRLMDGIDRETRELFYRCMLTIDANVMRICRETAQKEKR